MAGQAIKDYIHFYYNKASVMLSYYSTVVCERAGAICYKDHDVWWGGRGERIGRRQDLGEGAKKQDALCRLQTRNSLSNSG